MSNALHDYAKLFERYAANNCGTGAILAGEDCLALANEMRMDADAIDAENAKLRELCKEWYRFAYELFDDFVGEPELNEDFMTLEDRLRELGVDL